MRARRGRWWCAAPWRRAKLKRRWEGYWRGWTRACRWCGRGCYTVVAGAVAQRRLTLELVGAFGALALALAALGIYGVVAYTTAARQGEIGMRMALGAGRRGIMRLVLGSGVKPVLAGLAA